MSKNPNNLSQTRKEVAQQIANKPAVLPVEVVKTVEPAVMKEVNENVLDLMIDDYAKVVAPDIAVVLAQKLLSLGLTGEKNADLYAAFDALSNQKDFLNDYNNMRKKGASEETMKQIMAKV